MVSRQITSLFLNNFCVFQLSTKALKGTTLVHSKVFKPTSFVLAKSYIYKHCSFLLICAITGILHLRNMHYYFLKLHVLCYNKSRSRKKNKKTFFPLLPLVALRWCPVNSEVWNISRFKNKKSHQSFRSHLLHRGLRGTSIHDVIFAEPSGGGVWRETKQNQKQKATQTWVSSEFSAAVCVALYRDELLYAGGAALVDGAAPRVGGRPQLVALAEDVGHGVGAALDVAAVEERAAVVADLLHPVQDQVGLSMEGEGRRRC